MARRGYSLRTDEFLEVEGMSGVLHRQDRLGAWVGRVAPLVVVCLSLGLVGGMLFFPRTVTPGLAAWVAALGMGLAAWAAVVREWRRGGRFWRWAGVLAALWVVVVAWLSAWGARQLGAIVGQKSALGGLLGGFAVGMVVGWIARGLEKRVRGRR